MLKVKLLVICTCVMVQNSLIRNVIKIMNRITIKDYATLGYFHKSLFRTYYLSFFMLIVMMLCKIKLVLLQRHIKCS